MIDWREWAEDIFRATKKASCIGISGHVHPDGDCIGSCLALLDYLKGEYPDRMIDVYLENIPPEFAFLKGADLIRHEPEEAKVYDLFISLDCSTPDRLGPFEALFAAAGDRICIDHHITNEGYARVNVINPEASSTCEILYELFDKEKISHACAEALYTGIIHDTGVFKHSNTSRRVMEIAGALIEKGVNTEMIQEETFFKKTYLQNQILGRALVESVMILDGRMIFSSISAKDIRFYGVSPSDFDGIVSQLKVTEGVECALFMYETEPDSYKISLRSSDAVDVSKIAASFGGGGHKKAAGASIYGKRRDIIMNIAALVEGQLNGHIE